jgi:lipopolysaccharide biosynthesis glycosyltransferase
VATATNRAYLPWCATALLSAVERTVECRVAVHVLVDSDVGHEDKERLRRALDRLGAATTFIALARSDLSGLPPAVNAHGGAISCARFLLPHLLPNVHRLLYLDADTLTLDSLAPLVDLPLNDAPLGAVRNVVEPAMRGRLVELGLDPARYLNSGVLLMDLDVMRERRSSEALLACVRNEADRLLWVDQDALNLVFRDEWHELSPRWNVQNSFWVWTQWTSDLLGQAAEEARRRPGVLHFEGPSLNKPWHFLCRHPYREAYREVADRGPWGPVDLEDRTWVTRLLGRLPDDRVVPAYVRLHAVRRRLPGTRSG